MSAVTVTAADREAAWPFRDKGEFHACYKEAWMNGRYDHIGQIKAFATHAKQARIDAFEEAAGIADAERDFRRELQGKATKKTVARDHQSMAIAAVHIATAIRKASAS